MLNALRTSAGTWVVRIFLMVLVASFAVWGIGDIFRAQSTTGVISVGERDFGGNEVAAAFNRDLRRLQLQFGPEFDTQQAREMGLLQTTVRQLIARGLFDEATRELDMTIPDDALSAEVLNNPGFKDEFGRFDRFRFENLMRENGFTEAAYLDATRRDMTRAQLLNGLTVGVHPPKALTEAFYRFQQERRVATVLALPDTALAEVAPPDEETLKAYHQNHAARYTAPEYRAVSYFTLKPADLLDEVAVSEDELRAAYEDSIGQYSIEARREVEQILLDSEAAAKEVAEAIAGGTDFYAAAQQFTGTDAEATKLGVVTPTSLPLPQAAVDAIFALDEGGVSAPVESDLGWHLFRVADVVAQASTRSFEEVREDVSRQLGLEKAAELMYGFANRIEDAFAGGASVEEVVAEFNLTLTRVPSIDQRGADRAGNAVPDLPSGQRFLAAAFEEQPGDEPRLLESDENDYFLVRVDGITEPAIRPLDEVRETVVADWTNDQRAQAAEAKIAELAEKARGGTGLEALKEDVGGTLTTTEPLLRTDFAAEAGFGEDAIKALFAATPGAVIVGANAAGTGRVIAKLESVRDASLTSAGEDMARIAQLVGQSIADDIRNQFQTKLANTYEVTVNQAALNSLFEQPTGQY
ncbi:MAG: SurA N-terminal domain-containing protein [Alphaproteobacteria bacterium]